MFFTTFAAEALARHVLRGEGITFPTTNWEIALHTADPTESGATTDEVSTADWTNYARATLARDTTDWGTGGAAGLGYRIPNAVAADFGTPTIVNSVTVTHLTIRDDAVADNGWWVGTLESPTLVQDGQPFTIATGDLGVTWRFLET